MQLLVGYAPVPSMFPRSLSLPEDVLKCVMPHLMLQRAHVLAEAAYVKRYGVPPPPHLTMRIANSASAAGASASASAGGGGVKVVYPRKSLELGLNVQSFMLLFKMAYTVLVGQGRNVPVIHAEMPTDRSDDDGDFGDNGHGGGVGTGVKTVSSSLHSRTSQDSNRRGHQHLRHNNNTSSYINPDDVDVDYAYHVEDYDNNEHVAFGGDDAIEDTDEWDIHHGGRMPSYNTEDFEDPI